MKRDEIEALIHLIGIDPAINSLMTISQRRRLSAGDRPTQRWRGFNDGPDWFGANYIAILAQHIEEILEEDRGKDT